jgi:hypothetical protein
MSKLPHLTKEEISSFKKMEVDFFRAYTLQDKIPLYRRVAISLHSLAVDKWINYKDHRKQEAIEHHLKACELYPLVAKDYPIFRKEAGLAK